jgi:hypothetical protein
MRFLLLTLAAAALVEQPRTGPRIYGPGVCGPIDPTYVNTATETGGQPFPMSPAEIVNMSLIMAETSRSDSVMLLWAGGASADQTTFTIPVDPSIGRVTFSATFDGTGGSAAIASPDGAVTDARAGGQDTVMNCGRILSVDAPVSGAWRVTLKPSERFWLVVHARSELDVLSTDFVRPGGRPGHEGLFPIEGQPIAGRPATLRVELSERDATAAEFTLLSRQGQPIARAELAPIGDGEFAGAVVLPNAAFRVALTGIDDAGVPVQRVHARLFRAERIEVVPGSAVMAPVGRAIALPFTVRNLGERGRFRVTALADGQLVTRVEPDMLDIGQAAEGRVTVFLPAPLAVDAGKEIEVRVVASLEGSSEMRYNSGVQRVTVVSPQ